MSPEFPNFNATGGQGSWPNIIAGIGGAWNNGPRAFIAPGNWHDVPTDHARIMRCASPGGSC